VVTVIPIPGVSQALLPTPVEAVRAANAVVRTVAPPPSSAASQNQVQAQARGLAQQAQDAAVKQAGLGPLIADLSLALETPGMPGAVQTAAQRVLAQAGPLNPNLSGADIAKAFSQSGLFLEARLAAEPHRSPVGRDMKAGLLMLKKVLEGFLATQAETPPARNPGPTPPPPFREGATSAQPPATQSLPHGASPAAVAKRIVTEADGALARTELFQLASLPTEALDGPQSRWLFEIPFTSPQGATVAQFEISRDGGGGAGADAERATIWRAGFSLEVEPLGPVHARISLAGDQAGVNIWAERPDGEAKLRMLSSALSMSLARFNIRSEVAVHPGAPPRPAAGAGQFVDQIS
jgi:hypothetical protein